VVPGQPRDDFNLIAVLQVLAERKHCSQVSKQVEAKQSRTYLILRCLIFLGVGKLNLCLWNLRWYKLIDLQYSPTITQSVHFDHKATI
jgi:hypothetical protein